VDLKLEEMSLHQLEHAPHAP
jgi:hypothetical protein